MADQKAKAEACMKFLRTAKRGLGDAHAFSAGWDEAEAHAASLGPVYEQGDPDPTPVDGTGDCPAQLDGRAFCTWPANHLGVHVAGDSQHVVAVWGDR